MGDRILVPYDGSDPATAALRFALERFPDEDIVVLYVVEPFAAHTEAGVEGHHGEWRETAQEHAEERFEEVEDVLDETDVAVETDWDYGRPAHVILQYVESEDIDHVVMGSHGRTGIGRVFLGSVAETTVRRSPVPVTVVRDRETTDSA